MTRRDWWTLGTFALLSAVGGPLLGVILFWWLPLVVSTILGRSLEDLAVVTVWLLTNFAILLPSSVLPAAALGALGTWMLVVLRDRDQGRRAMRLAGMGYGAVAGAVMSVLAQVQGYPYSAFGGGLMLVMSAVQSDSGGVSMLPFIGSTVAGGVTGLLSGLFIASRVRAGEPPPASKLGGWKPLGGKTLQRRSH